MKKRSILLCCFLISFAVKGYSEETGRPFMTFYTPAITGGHYLNWAFIQDTRGMMYVGNGFGVQEFDGSSWRMIKIPNGSFVRSFARDSSGRIYVGSATELGYLEEDAKGLTQYISLLDKIPPEDRGFNYVWSIHVTPEGVYYQTRERIFRFRKLQESSAASSLRLQKNKTGMGTAYPPRLQRGGIGLSFATTWKSSFELQIHNSQPLVTNEGHDLTCKGKLSVSSDQHEDWEVKVWRPGNPEDYFVHSFYQDKTLFTLKRGYGLMKMADDSLQMIPGGEMFKNDRIHIMLPFPGKKDTWLLGTVNRGFFIYNGKTFYPFKTEADEILIQGSLYDGKLLSNGLLALATLSRGFLIIDPQGKIIHYLNKESGLLSNTVASVYIDRQKNIWLGMAGGVCILEYNSGLDQFTLSSGAVPFYFQRHEGVLYASATDGVYYLDKKDSRFKYVSGMENSGSSNTLSMNGRLFASNINGIFLFQDQKSKMVLPYSAKIPAFNSLFHCRLDSSLILASATNGLGIIQSDRKKPEQLKMITLVPGIHDYIRQIVEPSPGTYWLSTYNSGIIRMHIKGKDFTSPVIERFGPEHHLPVGITSVFEVAGRIVFGTGKGFYIYDEKEGKFLPDPFFKEVNLGANPGECALISDPEGNIWANAGKETALYRKMPDGNYQLEKGITSRFADGFLYTIFPENKSTIWFGTTAGAIRLNIDKDKYQPVPFTALIRAVKLANDSSIYDGGTMPDRTDPDNYILSYRYNALTFEYAATSFIKPADNEFRTRLEKFDQNWSSWKNESKRNYTNLPHGKYIFRVEARNVAGQQSAETSFAFTIKAPWYDTAWAYIGYSLIIILSVAGLVRFRTRKLHARSLSLEKIVEQRTAQIQEQKNNVEQLSLIGRDITSSLSVEKIIRTIYKNVNNLMDASFFTIGLHNPEENRLDFPATIEENELMPFYSIPLTDEKRLAAWCFNHRQEVIVNDRDLDSQKYVEELSVPAFGKVHESILYMPLWNKEKIIGVISAKSFKKNAYTSYQVNILRNLATYSGIALENADSYRKLASLLDELKSTQDKLITQSRLAALGELTAGIAHEIKNPLNFVNNFASLNAELAEELNELIEKEKVNPSTDIEREIEDVLNTLVLNTSKIQEHSKRADSIVRSMLYHSRGASGEKLPSDINQLLEEALNLTYHGMRAQDTGFNVKIEKSLDTTIGKIEVIPQEISRAFLNIISNGCYEAYRKKQEYNGNFMPTISVKTEKEGKNVKISIRDNGSGIPAELKSKLFTPFFTTKPAGQGTGLGLSITYNIIVNQHKGMISFESEEGEFTEFIILLPL